MIKYFESGVKNEFRHNVGTAHSTLKYKQIQRTDSQTGVWPTKYGKHIYKM